ncbi:hypothetical protein CROQUDRAFT_43060 [Cronartium quercuum f. sp. fusiforme G11]|uniref:Uncharacterized protein n=1 Tax=Cronartium quercuum f. sp. fusiforme G11 TaxID=708437 RepID=A0A9P6NPN1_9BASI|nr:hypothetical protein CROQUDRAFT_43060 [Cronartium quercuum f. sp. fusiforme G11]
MQRKVPYPQTAHSPPKPATHYPTNSSSVTNNNHHHHQLSLIESLSLHLHFFRRGISDATNWDTIVDVLATNKTLRSIIIQNATLQLVLLTSVISFDLLPRFIHRDISHLRFLFDIFWLYPISLGSTIWNGLLSVRDSKSVFTTSAHARRISTFITRPSVEAYKGLTHTVVSESYRGLVLLNYFAFSHALARVPYIGIGLSFVYCTIANSFYCFDRSWTKAGLSFEERIQSLEERWAYHAGFGMAITTISFWHQNLLVNLSLFTLFFPLLSILSSSSSTRPLPWSPTYPLASSNDNLDQTPLSQSKISSVFPVRLPIFILSVKLYAVIIHILRPVNYDRYQRGKHSGAFRLNEMEGGTSPDLGGSHARDHIDAVPWGARPRATNYTSGDYHSNLSQASIPIVITPRSGDNQWQAVPPNYTKVPSQSSNADAVIHSTKAKAD